MSKCDRQKNSSRNHVRRYRKRLFESNESNAVHLNTSRSFDISEKALITGKGMMSLDEFEKWFNNITKKVFQKRHYNK